MKNRLVFIPAAVIVLIFFIIGSIYDLEISINIANTNLFITRIVAGMASLPLCLVMCFISGSFIKLVTLKRYKERYKNILLIVFAIIYSAGSFILFGAEMVSYLALNLSKIFIIHFGIIPVLIGGVSGFFLFKYIDKKDYIKTVIYLTITCVACFCFVYGFKLIGPRARFTSIIDPNFGKSYYRPWYSPSLTQEMIDKLRNSPLGNQEAESFPSGHSSSAFISCILLASLPMFIDKLKGKEWMLFYIGFIYYAFIAFMRVLAGHHFVSDVTFTGIMDLMVYFICNEIYVRKFKGDN